MFGECITEDSTVKDHKHIKHCELSLHDDSPLGKMMALRDVEKAAQYDVDASEISTEFYVECVLCIPGYKVNSTGRCEVEYCPKKHIIVNNECVL